MTDPLKAKFPCLEHGKFGPHRTGTYKTWLSGDDCPGGREVLLVPTDDIDTERIIAESVARYVETVGDAVDAAAQARKRLKAAVGTTWRIEEIE